ncbi:hypothetical protein EYF80_015280 [Liparis tanakae]|uniref:Uncharacterized protein n=1 Tax=Liparis tanakae TaxID=230148 RepID=A0A4Z2I9E0_9TELE|nr:hypothetical protein EYF80_015280 [Liparis tanakae]
MTQLSQPYFRKIKRPYGKLACLEGGAGGERERECVRVVYLVKNPVDVGSLLGIGHHYGAQQHLQALRVSGHK